MISNNGLPISPRPTTTTFLLQLTPMTSIDLYGLMTELHAAGVLDRAGH
jgi:hypothetical protein